MAQTKEELIVQAGKYAKLCNLCNLSLFDLLESIFQDIDLNVMWRHLTPEIRRDCNFGTDDGLSMFISSGSTPSKDTLYILTAPPTDADTKPLFVTGHEVAHWLLGHAQFDLFFMGKKTTQQEFEAGYFCLVLLYKSPTVVQNIFFRQLTLDELKEHACHFIAGLKPTNITAEISYIDGILNKYGLG